MLPRAAVIENVRPIFTGSQHGTMEPEFANKTIEKHTGLAPRPEQARNQLQFLDIQLQQIAIPESPQNDILVEERFPQIEISHRQSTGSAGRRDESANRGPREWVALGQGAVDHHGCLACHPGCLSGCSDEIPRRRGGYVINRTARIRSHVHHTRGMHLVPLHVSGVDAGLRELAEQIMTILIATNARTKRNGNGSRIGQMECDIRRSAARAFARGKHVDQTLANAEDACGRSRQDDRLFYGLTGVGLGVAVGVGVGVGRGVAVGLGVGRGVAVGLGVGRGVAVGLGVGRGVAVGLGVGRGVAVGTGVGRGVVTGVTMGSGPGSTKEVVATVGAGTIEGMAPIGERGRLAMRVVEAWLSSVIWAPPVELEIVAAPLLTAPSSTTIKPSPSVNGSPSVVVTIPEPETEATVTLPSGSVAADAFTKVTPDVTGLKLPFGVTTTTAAVSELSPVA